MGGGTETGDGHKWAVGGEPHSGPGKETPARVDTTQQLPSQQIQKPVAAALPKPIQEPARKERTLGELQADRAERRGAIERTTKEASESLDTLQAQADLFKKTRDDTVKTLEIRRAGEISRLDSKRDSELGNIDAGKTEHVSEAAEQRGAEKEKADNTHSELLNKISTERASAEKEIEDWYAARAYELDPENSPGSLVSRAVKDPRLASALKTGAAEPMGSEFMALEMGAIQKKRTERLEEIEGEFDTTKETLDESCAHKHAAADEKYEAVVKGAEETAIREKKAIAERHAAEIAKLTADTEKGIESARSKTNEGLIAIAKKMEEVKAAFAANIAVLKDVNKLIPANLKKPEPELKGAPSGVQEDAVPLHIAGKPESYESASRPADEEAESELTELARKLKEAPAAKKPMPRWLRMINAAAWSGIVGATMYFYPDIAGWEPSGKTVETATAVSDYIERGGEQVQSGKSVKGLIEKRVAEKRAKAELAAAAQKKHEATQQERKQLAERIAALKAAREVRNADAALSKALNQFGRRIGTMKNEKGGFLYLGKGSVSYAREIAVMAETKGKALSVKQKNRIAGLLSRNDMSRKQLKALHAHVGALIAVQSEINKASVAATKAGSQKRAVHEAAAKIKAVAQPSQGKAVVQSGPSVPASEASAGPAKTAKRSVDAAVEKIDSIVTAGSTAAKKAEEKGPKKETIMAPAPSEVKASGGAAPANVLPSPYAASAGAKPPWMDWAAGIDNPNDYVTNTQASKNYVELPGARTTTAAPAAGTMSTTLASAKKEDVTKAPERLVEAAMPAKESKPAKDTDGPAEDANEGLMVLGDNIYAYPGQRLSPKPHQTVYGFTTREGARYAYLKAKNAAAVPGRNASDVPDDIRRAAEALGMIKDAGQKSAE
ncbi:Uncharacterised protein [uncultured archaeon]|nr:Uncharacterised protein [uncultured archaeon]